MVAYICNSSTWEVEEKNHEFNASCSVGDIVVRKVVGYKINTEKSLAFLYINQMYQERNQENNPTPQPKISPHHNLKN